MPWRCIHHLELKKHSPDISPTLNNANTSDNETNVLDLDIKIIGSDINTSVNDKRKHFVFSIIIFIWLSGDVLGPISQLVRFAMCYTRVLNLHSKIL